MRQNILREGSAERKQLDKIQAKIREAGQAIDAIERGFLPAEEVKARLLAAFRNDVYRYAPENGFTAFQILNSSAIPPREMSFDRFLYLFGVDETVELVMKRLAASGRPAGLPEAERATKIRELRAKLDELEREEEIETLRLREVGHIILRREDVRKEVLRQVWAERGA